MLNNLLKKNSINAPVGQTKEQEQLNIAVSKIKNILDEAGLELKISQQIVFVPKVKQNDQKTSD